MSLLSQLEQDIQTTQIHSKKGFMEQYKTFCHKASHHIRNINIDWYWCGGSYQSKMDVINILKKHLVFHSFGGGAHFFRMDNDNFLAISFVEKLDHSKSFVFFDNPEPQTPTTFAEFCKKQQEERLSFAKERSDGFLNYPYGNMAGRISCIVCNETDTVNFKYHAYKPQNSISICGYCYDAIKPEKKINVEISEKDYQAFLDFKKNLGDAK